MLHKLYEFKTMDASSRMQHQLHFFCIPLCYAAIYIIMLAWPKLQECDLTRQAASDLIFSWLYLLDQTMFAVAGHQLCEGLPEQLPGEAGETKGTAFFASHEVWQWQQP